MISKDEECIDYELLFKIIIVGESCVGKTNIISRYLNDEFKKINQYYFLVIKIDHDYVGE